MLGSYIKQVNVVRPNQGLQCLPWSIMKMSLRLQYTLTVNSCASILLFVNIISQGVGRVL